MNRSRKEKEKTGSRTSASDQNLSSSSSGPLLMNARFVVLGAGNRSGIYSYHEWPRIRPEPRQFFPITVVCVLQQYAMEVFGINTLVEAVKSLPLSDVLQIFEESFLINTIVSNCSKYHVPAERGYARPFIFIGSSIKLFATIHPGNTSHNTFDTFNAAMICLLHKGEVVMGELEDSDEREDSVMEEGVERTAGPSTSCKGVESTAGPSMSRERVESTTGPSTPRKRVESPPQGASTRGETTRPVSVLSIHHSTPKNSRTPVSPATSLASVLPSSGSRRSISIASTPRRAQQVSLSPVIAEDPFYFPSISQRGSGTSEACRSGATSTNNSRPGHCPGMLQNPDGTEVIVNVRNITGEIVAKGSLSCDLASVPDLGKKFNYFLDSMYYNADAIKKMLRAYIDARDDETLFVEKMREHGVQQMEAEFFFSQIYLPTYEDLILDRFRNDVVIWASDDTD